MGKCRPQVYSDLIRSNIPSSSGVSPSCSPCSTSPLPFSMETYPGEPLVVKPTRGELRAHVELLAKKRRSVKCKAQDPPESGLPARGKVPKLGVSDLIQGVRGGVCVASLVLRCKSQGFFGKGCQTSSESPSYLCLESFGVKHLASPSDTGRCGGWSFEADGVRTRYSPMRSFPSGSFRLSFETLISRKSKPCALRRLWPCPSRGPSLYV